jgi:hypothetical protein
VGANTTNAALGGPAPDAVLTTLREVVERLAPLDRRAGTEAEHETAAWLADRLTAGGAAAEVEEEEFRDGYARLLAALTALGVAAGGAALGRRTRRAGLLGGVLAAGLIADDVSNGLRPFRRAVAARKTTWNVVAEAGDAAAERTLVVLAHHDAAPTGRIFDQGVQRWFGETFPGIVERMDTSFPLWWPVVGSPVLVALGAASGRRGLAATGLSGCALATAAFLDIARSPVVPGANDNLSAVAAIVALAEALRERPVEGVRVLLVSCGAEEVLQGGVYGFARRHLARLDRERTWVLNLDTLGSPELILIEGEGPLVMEDYFDRGFRDLVARAAAGAGVPMRRGMRARSSTDAVVPARRGFPTATVASWNRYKSLSNYHLMSDTPDNLDYGSVAGAVALCEAVVRELEPAGTRATAPAS